MPTLTTTRNYADTTSLTQLELDAAFNSIESFINTTKLDSSNIQTGSITSGLLAPSSVTTGSIASGAVTTSAIANGAITRPLLAATEVIPTASILPYAMAVAPTGWLNCDGSAVNRSTYSSLFAVIGTTFGVGDGSTTFALPDLRSRVVVGQGQGSGLTNRVVADNGGEENHTLVTSEMPNHTHTLSGQVKTVQNINASSGVGVTLQGNGNPDLSLSSTGGDGAHNNMQPFLVLNYIIKF